MKPKHSTSRHRVIPLEEDMRRLFQECKFAHGNAALLSESLTFAKPEDLEKDIIRVSNMSFFATGCVHMLPFFLRSSTRDVVPPRS